MYAKRNTILRYIAGGSGRQVGQLHKARRIARKADKWLVHNGQEAKHVKAFYAKVKSLIPTGNDTLDNHIHPRHKRESH